MLTVLLYLHVNMGHPRTLVGYINSVKLPLYSQLLFRSSNNYTREMPFRKFSRRRPELDTPAS